VLNSHAMKPYCQKIHYINFRNKRGTNSCSQFGKTFVYQF